MTETKKTSFRNATTLMVQGTTSDAGKSVLVAALCRILARRGESVAPFKPQNMALNSAVTKDGGEIGRAQAVQAEACYLEPVVEMNPVLLKPNSDIGAQVIVLGKAVGNLDASKYHDHKPKLLDAVIDAHDRLKYQYTHIIVEGAGSPAEINLREHDIANMGFAEAVDCPVIIVADIDRGGVFAHLVGTYDLLSREEKLRVKGFVINRFRGDISLLEPGLKWLEARTQVPVLGVIPYLMDLHIEAEDAINTHQVSHSSDTTLNVVIPVYPRISNHTDFDVLRLHPNVNCLFVRSPDEAKNADLIILPGSKSVRSDLNWLSETGWTTTIQKHLRYGGKLLGICGGYQMLGQSIHDPLGIESDIGSSRGLGYLDIETQLTSEKTLTDRTGSLLAQDLLTDTNQQQTAPVMVKGYEIHAGQSQGAGLLRPLFALELENNASLEKQCEHEGAVSEDGQVIGTYLHGVLDQSELLNRILSWAGLTTESQSPSFDYDAYRDSEMNRLADAVEASLGINTILQLLSRKV